MALSNRSTMMAAALGLMLCLVPLASSQGLPVQFGLLPLGDLTTVDQDGPYMVPAVQSHEIEAALAAKTGAPGAPFTDADVLNFLANTECLEATFNTFAAFGAGLPESLKPGQVVGAKRANLSEEVQSWAEEVALDEQGHVRMIREVLGNRSVPCPALNIGAGFQAYFDAAVRMVSNPPFDPFKNDVNFLLATWSLEEIGATGDKGCILLASNPGVSNCIAGLAGAASYQSGVDRHFLWQRRNETVPEYNMTVHQIVEAISNIRDTWDGPAEVDQPLYNGNPNFIAVPSGNINLVPTDLRGLTFSRTPQQVLRIVTLGSETGKGGFFPEGVNGRINSPVGFNVSANAFGGYPGNNVMVMSLEQVNKTALLNTNITNVTAAPLEVQAEASGQQYKTSDVSSTDAPDVTLIGTAASPSPDFTAAESVDESGENTALNGTSPSPEFGSEDITSPAPGADSENVTSPAPGSENATSPSPDAIIPVIVVPVGVDNATSPSPAVGTENITSPAPEVGTENTTSPAPVSENVTSPAPDAGLENVTSPTPDAIPAVIVPVEGAENATSPAPIAGTENATSPAPDAAAIPAVIVPVEGAENATSPAPSAGTETVTSPSPDTTATTSPSPTDGAATDGNTIVAVPITTALNQTSTNETALTEEPAAFTTTSEPESSPTPTPSPVLADGGNTTGDNTTGIIAPIASPAVAVLTTSPLPEGAAGAANAASPVPATGTENGTSASPAPATNETLAVAVGNLTDNQTAAVADAVREAAENVTDGAADTTVAGASPAPGARKLRFMRWL